MAWPPRLVLSQQERIATLLGSDFPSHNSADFSFLRRSGKSVRISAATSPRTPCGRRIRATVMRFDATGFINVFAQAACVAPTALEILYTTDPALPGWAKLFRA